ncbi:hypothetical protein KQX54_010998 [Cotesia glomerata]|uniref:Uncharacterized protein n=1 Tax=Cotesia glomerata TaxID=32391 RepID=A0AAV7HJL2_COTGL|nr:hypothetical protein KQX54_010998 [Cotesia glomerata]
MRRKGAHKSKTVEGRVGAPEPMEKSVPSPPGISQLENEDSISTYLASQNLRLVKDTSKPWSTVDINPNTAESFRLTRLVENGDHIRIPAKPEIAWNIRRRELKAPADNRRNI